MSRADRLALLLSLLAILAGYFVSTRIFEGMAHLEDEMAYLWQAQAVAGGRLALPSPPEAKSFLVPFVIDYNGQRFGKYPLGWPVTLALGERFGLRTLVNPLLAGLGIWLIYLLGKRLFGETVALLSAGLALISPFFLMNSGSLLSHPLGLVLSTALALAWVDNFTRPPRAPDASPEDSSSPVSALAPRWIVTLAGGGALGLLALSRPLTAVAVGLPFGLHGVYLLITGSWRVRRHVLALGLTAMAMAALHIVWQYAMTGDPFLNPYTLWWPYDKVGFGPGYGHIEGGHTLKQAWINTRFSLYTGRYDLFGWGGWSWIFIPFGLLAVLRDRNARALLPLSVLPSLVVVYLAYWIGSWLFGPRYYYEGLYSATLASAAGIALLAGWPTRPGKPFPNYRGWKRLRPLGMTVVLALLAVTSVLFYTPARLNTMFGLYGVQRAHLKPFETPQAQELAPALIIVHTRNGWIEYGRLLELQTPFLDTPFIFVISRGPKTDWRVSQYFPERQSYHYYPADAPYTFYKDARR